MIEYKLRQDVFHEMKHFDTTKNLMVFVTGTELIEGGWEFMKDDDYFDKSIRYMKAQIDNSLDLGWKPEDIILATNFDFEYKGVKNYTLKETCDYSQFLNKEYAISELIQEGVIKDSNIFYHDLDAFQLQAFDFPTMKGDIGGCIYPGGDGHSVQCGVLYTKTSASDIWKDMADKMKTKEFQTGNDEIIIRGYVKLNNNYDFRFTPLDTSYNVGMTSFNERVQEAVGYLKVCHFHPDDEKQYDCMVNGVNQLNRKIIDERLLNILKSHDLEPEKA